MYHLIYVTRYENKYYIGSHSTKRLNDGYMGSGRWVKSIKDRTKLKRKVIAFYENVEDMRKAEKRLIAKHIQKDNCMNWIYGTHGLTSNDVKEKNPMYGKNQSEHQKEIVRKMMIENNPMKKEENKKYGENNPMWGKPSAHRTPRIYKGKTYKSLYHMADELGVCRQTARRWWKQELSSGGTS